MLKRVTFEYKKNGVQQPINALSMAVVKNNKNDIRAIAKFELSEGDSSQLLASGDNPVIRLSFWFDPEDDQQAEHAGALLETIENHPLYDKISRVDLDVEESDL